MDYHFGISGQVRFSAFPGSYLDVDLGDTLSVNRILDVIGCDGTLQLHLPSAKSPLRYLVGSRTLIFHVGNAEWDSEPKHYDAA